jgi:hypothetical protein
MLFPTMLKINFYKLIQFLILISHSYPRPLTMMRSLLCCPLGVISLSVNAQKPLTKLGDVSKEALSMTSYDKDSIASAVIVADYGTSAIGYGLSWGNFHSAV